MSIVTPTITTDSSEEYNSRLELIESYAEGVHLDFADGDFAPTKLLPIKQARRSENLITHAHIMYRRPYEALDDIEKLGADLVVLHAESEDVKTCLMRLQENGTRTGIALLPQTSLDDLKALDADDLFDHILIFGGLLGYQGGEADLSQLEKVRQIKQAYPDAEIGWDGGVNADNAAEIAAAGVDILNVGAFLRDSSEPKRVYKKLTSLLNNT